MINKQIIYESKYFPIISNNFKKDINYLSQNYSAILSLTSKMCPDNGCPIKTLESKNCNDHFIENVKQNLNTYDCSIFNEYSYSVLERFVENNALLYEIEKYKNKSSGIKGFFINLAYFFTSSYILCAIFSLLYFLVLKSENEFISYILVLFNILIIIELFSVSYKAIKYKLSINAFLNKTSLLFLLFGLLHPSITACNIESFWLDTNLNASLIPERKILEIMRKNPWMYNEYYSNLLYLVASCNIFYNFVIEEENTFLMS